MRHKTASAFSAGASLISVVASAFEAENVAQYQQQMGNLTSGINLVKAVEAVQPYLPFQAPSITEGVKRLSQVVIANLSGQLQGATASFSNSGDLYNFFAVATVVSASLALSLNYDGIRDAWLNLEHRGSEALHKTAGIGMQKARSIFHSVARRA